MEKINEQANNYENRFAEFESFVSDVGDHLDADGKLRFKNYADVETFVEMAKEAGFEVSVREPKAEKAGASGFTNMINSYYTISLKE